MRERLIGVKPFMNPMPPKNHGGDCFACSLKAAVDHLYPDNPVPFETAWDAFLVVPYQGKERNVLSNTWHTMAWDAPHHLGYGLDVHHDIVLPEINLRQWSHAWGWTVHEGDFAMRLEAWLAAGRIPIVEMSLNPAEEGKKWTNHFAILDGQRNFWEQHPTVGTAKFMEYETHVVCSNKGPYWIKTADLINKHGVAGMILLRNRF